MQSSLVSLQQNLSGVLNAASSSVQGMMCHSAGFCTPSKFPSCILSCAALRKLREGQMQEGRGLQPSNWGL